MATEKLVLGRYRVLERVGRGAMGVIYRGLDPVLDREVAIKVMSADFASEGEETRKRFFREARAAARLQHRNIVTIFEFAEEDGVPYIVMEFLRGGNLAARIAAGPALALERKLDILIELCDGLQYAGDNGVIHRDVKPANVWLLDDGSVKLVDFGIAKIITATSTLGRDVIGSAAYMSPEQAEGQVVDARTDIFSAAVVLYELVAGRRPFEASTPTATLLKIVQEPMPPITAPNVPAALVAAIEKALSKNPSNRYQSAGEFGSELRFIRAMLIAGSESGLTDPALVSTTTRATAVPATTRLGRTGTGTAWHSRSVRLLLAAAFGGIVMAGVLYWSRPAWFLDITGALPAPTPTGSSGTVGKPVSGPDQSASASTTGTSSLGTADPKATGTPAPPKSPMMLTLQVSAEYDFEIQDDNGGPLSAPKRRHALSVRSSMPRVRLLARDVLLDLWVSAREWTNDGPTVRSIQPPRLATVFFVGTRGDCRPVHKLKDDIKRPKSQLTIVAGHHEFRFVCDDGSSLAPVSFNLGAGDQRSVYMSEKRPDAK